MKSSDFSEAKVVTWHNPVRLACVKHAASVHPEPGSNSLIKYLLIRTRISLAHSYPLKLIPLGIYFVYLVLLLKFILFLEFFSGLHYCLFVKVLLPCIWILPAHSFNIVSQPLCFVKAFFNIFYFFLKICKTNFLYPPTTWAVDIYFIICVSYLSISFS